MDFRQSSFWASYLAASGWKTSRLPEGALFAIRSFPILGTALRIGRPENPIPFESIETYARATGCSFIKLEPDATNEDVQLRKQLAHWGYQKDSWSIEPTRTQVIDLTKPIDVLFKDCKPKWRQYIRLAQNLGITVEESADINTFTELWAKNARRKRHLVESRQRLISLWNAARQKKQAALLFAKVGDRVVAGSFLLFQNGSCHLWHNAYDGSYESSRPLYLLVWRALEFAKIKGAKTFDLEGIEDPELPYTKYLQPTFFKHGFGGEPKQYIGSFVKYYLPIASLPFRLFGRIHPGMFRFIYKLIYG